MPSTHDSTRTSALGWRRAQALSGVMLAGFAALHLLNLPFALVPGGYDAYQRMMRVLYQSPLFEIPFVIAPLVVHVICSVRGMLRTDRAPARTWPERLHRWSAWYLLLVIAGHVLATRGASLFYGVYPESAGIAFTLVWIPLFFWPYYAVLAISGVLHLGYGLPRAISVLRRTGDRSQRSVALMVGLLLTAMLVALGLLGFSGALYPIEDPFASDYAAMYRDMDSPLVPHVPDPR